MCLVALAWKPGRSLQFLLAANRDEFHVRPSLPLAPWVDAPQILAGRDQSGGGTWLGLSTQGRLAVVTNIRLPTPPPALRTRGLLAADFLRGDAPPVAHHIRIQPTLPDYGPCNLLIADSQQACYLSNHPGFAPRILQPGLYGLSNASLDAPWPKVVSLKAAVRRWLHLGGVRSAIEPLFDALASTDQPADALLPDTGVGLDRERTLAPAFIRGAEYGTRCSTLLWVTEDGEGCIRERRFGPGGVALGETQLRFRWPVADRH